MKKYIYIGPVVLVLIWFAVTKFKMIDVFFLPGPIDTARELLRLFTEKIIIGDFLSTLKRIFLSFVLATAIGLPIGLIIGRLEKVYRSLEFVIDFFRSIAPLALFPLFLIIFGITDVSKVAVATFSAMLVIIFNVAYGIMNSKKSRILAAQIMGATNLQIFRSVVFWESLPQTFVGLRNAMSWIIAVVVATEMFVGTNSGLGHKISDFQVTYNIPGVYATILIVGIMGYIINFLFLITEKKFVHWSGK